MIRLRQAADRGRTQLGWLDSRHSFSFGGYHDPQQMGFRSLRVINDDRVAAGAGFATHGHRDMEIVSYVLDGALEHKDSLGTGSVIRPGEVQRMSAGTGIRHSEFNPSRQEPVHFLQIWLLPERDGLPPSYEQKVYPAEDRRGRFRLVGDRHGTDGAVTIHQDVRMYLAALGPGESASHQLSAGRGAWLQVARGMVELNGRSMKDGDGAAIEDEGRIEVKAAADAEVLLFDLG